MIWWEKPYPLLGAEDSGKLYHSNIGTVLEASATSAWQFTFHTQVGKLGDYDSPFSAMKAAEVIFINLPSHLMFVASAGFWAPINPNGVEYKGGGYLTVESLDPVKVCLWHTDTNELWKTVVMETVSVG